eukprot:scaffold9643_cov144-Isochrysis_galbana.AAC.3
MAHECTLLLGWSVVEIARQVSGWHGAAHQHKKQPRPVSTSRPVRSQSISETGPSRPYAGRHAAPVLLLLSHALPSPACSMCPPTCHPLRLPIASTHPPSKAYAAASPPCTEPPNPTRAHHPHIPPRVPPS